MLTRAFGTKRRCDRNAAHPWPLPGPAATAVRAVLTSHHFSSHIEVGLSGGEVVSHVVQLALEHLVSRHVQVSEQVRQYVSVRRGTVERARRSVAWRDYTNSY